MANKIILIRPKNIYNYNNYPPLNLISVGTALQNAGYDVEIINCAFVKESLDHIKLDDDLLFVGISILTSEIPDAYGIMKYIKDHSDVPIVVGGWHCTLFPEQMGESELVDFVVAGEGEEHILRIAEIIKNKEKNTRKIYPKTSVALDLQPCPNFGLEPEIERFVSSYLTDRLSQFVKQPMRWIPYETSRGCPSFCTFCINVVTDNMRYRKKSAAKVVDEVEHLIRAHGLTHLKIIDDNFFVDIRRVRAITEGIIARGLDITWDGECRCDYFRANQLNDETLALCRRSGLIQLTLGIESGSPHTLKLMKKNITPEQAEHAVKKCDEHGIIPRSSFILEIPGEDINDIRQTIKFINKLRRYKSFTCGVGTFRPYPKCELTAKLMKEGHLKEPARFEDWTDRKVIDMYTSAELVRPWQVNGEFSESAAYYLNMESTVRLGDHQLESPIDRIKNWMFMSIAKVRNRLLFFSLPFDKVLYKKFVLDFYESRRDLEQAGAYPLADPPKKDEICVK